MYNVGRNNPRVRARARRGARARDAGLGAARRDAAAGAARRGAARARAAAARALPLHEHRHGGGRGGAEARPRRDEAHPRHLRRPRLPRADARLALGERQPGVHGPRSGRCCPASSRVPFGDLDALEEELRREDVARLPRRAGAGQGRATCRRRATSRARRSSAAATARSSASTRCRPASAAPGRCSRSSTGGSSRISFRSRSRSRAATSRSARCSCRARCTRRVYDSMEHAVAHGSTFAPNELAMAAGLATLHELDEQGLVAHSARLGAKLLELTRAARRRVRRRARGARARADVGDRVRPSRRAEAARGG